MKQNTFDKISNVYIFLFIYAFVFLFVASESSPLYSMQARDCHVYFIMGKGLFSGITIYQGLFDHKGPLLYVIYGLGSLISKSSFIGIYVMESICLGITLILVRKIALMYLDQKYALMTTVLFPLFLLSGINATGGYPEEFMVPFIVSGLYLYLKYFNQNYVSHPMKYMFYHGIMIMAIFLIKMNVIIIWVGLLSAIFLDLLLKKLFKEVILNILALLSGLIIMALPFAIYFIVTNSFNDFIKCYWRFNFIYATENYSSVFLPQGYPPLLMQIADILTRLYYLLRTYSIQCCLIAVGLLSFCLKKYFPNPIGRTGLICSFILLLLTSYMQRGYSYYFIPICTYSILGCIVVIKILKENEILKCSTRTYGLIAFFCICCNFLRCKESFILLRTEEVFKKQFSPIINKEMNPTLFVMRFPNTPIEGTFLYNEANVMPNVKYFYDPIISVEKYPVILNTQIDYIKKKQAMFLSISSLSSSYIPPDYVLNNYEQISMLKYTGTDGITPSYHYLYKVKP